MLPKNCSLTWGVIACWIDAMNGREMLIRDAVEADLDAMNGREMLIRDAVEADLAAIVEIYNSTIACRTVTADLEPISVESRLAWFHSHTPDKRPLWVIEVEGEIAGWLGFQCFYSARRAYDLTAEISIYIAPAYRRQGIGRKLLQHAIAQCPKLHIKNLVGCIFATNKASLRLFENFGFEQWGFLPAVAEFEHETCDLVIVGRRIETTI